MTEPPIDLLGLTSADFRAAAATRGVRPPAALSIYRSAFRQNDLRDDLVTLTPAPLGRHLREGATLKFTQRLDDDLESESVILPQVSRGGRARHTLCVSSQIGCAMGCTFCETARMGLMRNLSAAQIVGQWHTARFALETPIDNIVFMGMGEPMDNLPAVLQAIRVLTDHNGASIAPSRITISTVGHIRGIEDLFDATRDEPALRRLNLAVSINASNDEVRSRIMPMNREASMTELRDAMIRWTRGSRARILIEYVFIPGVNDDLTHADELAAYLHDLPCTVNVIPYNPRRDSPWPAPAEDDVRTFVDRIADRGILVKRRQTLGRSVMAACGQLGNEHIRQRRRVDLTTSAPSTR